MDTTRENNKLSKWRLQDIASQILDGSRTAACLRRQNGNQTGVVCNGEGNAHYVGLQTCGSIWACPVCSQKIASRRRQEVTTAVERSGYTPVLITYTIQHSVKDKLKTLLNDLKAGLRYILNGRFRKLFYGQFKVKGYIRSVEIRWGKAGWHPHVHELLLIDGEADVNGINDFIYGRYGDYLVSKGYHINEHTLDVRSTSQDVNETISDYLTKSSIELELSSGQWKDGYSLAPFQLLAALEETGEMIYSELFREYAEATAGKKWLTWSRGLKAELLPDVEEEDDESIASKEEEGEIILTLDRKEWWLVCDRGLRGELLLAVKFGFDMADWLFLKGIRTEKPD